MSSIAVLPGVFRRDPDRQRVLTRRRVLGAATALADQASGSEGAPTVPELATHARITPTALRAHFPSIDAVFANVYLDRMRHLPLNVDPSIPAASRVSEQLRLITEIFDDEAQLAVVCTRALLGEDGNVAEIRTRIGEELHRRVTASLGAGAWPEVVTTLETVFWGALLQMKTGTLGRRTMAAHLETMAAVIIADS